MSEVLETARRTVARSYRHSLVPFERVIESLRESNQLQPDFRLNVMFDFFAECEGAPRFLGLTTSPMIGMRDRSPIEFTTKVRRQKKGASVIFTFQRSAFTDEEISGVFGFYRQVLRWMVSSPELRLRDVGMFAPLRIATCLELPDRADEQASTTVDPEEMLIPAADGRNLAEVQAIVSDIWKEAFGVNDVGLDDDFFHLGGHSMMAVQIALQISDELKVDVPLEALFSEAPTIRSLSESVMSTLLSQFGDGPS